jgi:CheY-like chemotaxis protein
VKIVASNNSFVFDELGSQGFRVVNAQSVIVSTGEEALTAAREHRPELVILDADMPGIDGCSVCEQLKSDPNLRVVRVILVVQGSISSAQLKRLAASGCDDVVLYRVPGEDLYHHAARLCGLPDLSLGEPVKLHVSVSGGDSPEISAHALHLSHRSVELLSSSNLPAGARVQLRLRREDDPEAVAVSGEVLTTTVDGAAQAFLSRVNFVDITPAARARLADLALWEARQLADGLRVAIRGAFDEVSDFAGLRRRIARNVIFDLSGVRAITSWGARSWILFLRSLPDETEYQLVNCSTLFVKHCSMVADMLGRGQVISFALPYECSECSHENARVLQTSSLSASLRREPPEFRCGRCGGLERFADLPDRYFSFLPPPP